MNENDKISPIVVNDPLQRSIEKIANRVRNKIMRRHLYSLQPRTTTLPAPLLVDTDESRPQQLNDSFEQLSNAISPSKGHKSQSKIDTPAASLCNMCCRKDDVCVNLQHSHATVLTVSDITRLPSWDIRQILASVCSRCLVYISAITESSSKLRMRCEQAMHSQTVVVAPPTPDTSPNNFLQVSTTLLDDTPGHSNNETQSKCYMPGYCEDTPNGLHLPLATTSSAHFSLLPLTIENQTFQAMSRSPSPNNASQNSMLRIHYERPVSPLNTESGGGGRNRKRNYQRINVIPVQMICAHCNRAYWRKDYYRKHMRRCSAKYRYAKSVVPQRLTSTSRLDFDTISVVSEGNERITNYQHRTFRCNICTVTVDNIRKLRQHKRIHLPRYYCDICNSEYTSQNEYDFHRIQCLAKMEVFQKTLLDATNETNTLDSRPARRKTRSFSRALSAAPSLAPSTKSVQTISKKSKMAEKNVPKQNDNDDEQSTITNYVKRHKSAYSEVSMRRYVNTVDDDCDEDDDNLSEVDTQYSKRLSLTNHWVEEHSISSHSYLSQSDNYVNDYVEDVPFPTLKEYDLYLLERLKSEVTAHCITCFMPDCSFTCSTLNEMMIHDYIYHYKKPWFYCQKCGFCFTSKVFLDFHLDLQNKGRYVCYKCGGNFEYQHQLDRHLIQHNRLASKGGEKYVCHFCNFAFLDEDKLLKHCYYENHNWNAKRQIIEIDHSMTISNKVPQRNCKKCKSKKYHVKILNMVLKRIPSKRCTPMEKYRFHMPPHLRIPSRIGQVEFYHSTNPNCVGCL